MTIDYPSAAQIPQLRRLWTRAFGDGDEFLDLFFAAAYAPDRCRCVSVGGTVAAALYWFEDSCDGRPFVYVYAVATDPDFRGRGLCRALMEDTAKILRGRGVWGILLHPADEGLARMYGKMGYEPCTAVAELRREAAEEGVRLRKIDAAEYCRLRRGLMPPMGVSQPGEAELLAGWAEFYAGEDFLVAVTAEDGQLRCHELLGNADAAPGILTALGCREGTFRIPGKQESFAFLKKLRPDCPVPGYFGLALD